MHHVDDLPPTCRATYTEMCAAVADEALRFHERRTSLEGDTRKAAMDADLEVHIRTVIRPYMEIFAVEEDIAGKELTHAQRYALQRDDAEWAKDVRDAELETELVAARAEHGRVAAEVAGLQREVEAARRDVTAMLEGANMVPFPTLKEFAAASTRFASGGPAGKLFNLVRKSLLPVVQDRQGVQRDATTIVRRLLKEVSRLCDLVIRWCDDSPFERLMQGVDREARDRETSRHNTKVAAILRRIGRTQLCPALDVKADKPVAQAAALWKDIGRVAVESVVMSERDIKFETHPVTHEALLDALALWAPLCFWSMLCDDSEAVYEHEAVANRSMRGDPATAVMLRHYDSTAAVDILAKRPLPSGTSAWIVVPPWFGDGGVSLSPAGVVVADTGDE